MPFHDRPRDYQPQAGSTRFTSDSAAPTKKLGEELGLFL
jgi:hypothetical protein